jgi:hypothetical protein
MKVTATATGTANDNPRKLSPLELNPSQAKMACPAISKRNNIIAQATPKRPATESGAVNNRALIIARDKVKKNPAITPIINPIPACPNRRILGKPQRAPTNVDPRRSAS